MLHPTSYDARILKIKHEHFSSSQVKGFYSPNNRFSLITQLTSFSGNEVL